MVHASWQAAVPRAPVPWADGGKGPVFELKVSTQAAAYRTVNCYAGVLACDDAQPFVHPYLCTAKSSGQAMAVGVFVVRSIVEAAVDVDDDDDDDALPRQRPPKAPAPVRALSFTASLRLSCVSRLCA